MDLNANNIEKGMEVYGSDGDKIGSISDVYTGAGSGGTAGGYGGASGTQANQGLDNADFVVEEVDVVEVVPDYTASGMGTSSGSGAAATTGSGSQGTSGGASGTTWNAGTGSTGDLGEMGTATDQNTSPGYVPGGSSAGSTAGSGYLHVEQGGVLGIGAKDLYIPMSVVQDVDPGNCVSLSVTKQQADDSYQNKPAFLDTSNS